MHGAPSPDALRSLVLAVSVLEDLDLTPQDDGVLLDGPPAVHVPWAEVRRALDGADPSTDEARAAVALRLRWHRLIAEAPLEELVDRLRPVGCPTEHDLHPGLDWVRSRVLGDALDLGPGFAGLYPEQPDDVVVVPQQVLDVRGVDVGAHWATALDLLEEMGALAAERFRRDPAQPLRPLGDCDVVTLIASRSLRRALVADAGGMRPLAVPMRTRGWVDLRRVDPAYARAAAALTSPQERGFSRPLLITAEEVALATPGGRPHVLELLDPAPASRGWRTDGGTHLPGPRGA